MATKIKSVSVIAARIVLGLIYFVFGLNFFLHFLPTPPSSGGLADAFLGGLFQSGYFFPMLKVTELICGLMLVSGRFVPLATVILAPIIINIFMFHTFVDRSGFPVAVFLVLANIFIAYYYRDAYSGLLKSK